MEVMLLPVSQDKRWARYLREMSYVRNAMKGRLSAFVCVVGL
jgi:hypothetical protein